MFKELWKINSIALKAAIDMYPYVSGEFKPSECQANRSRFIRNWAQ
jgi:hypothetical protein